MGGDSAADILPGVLAKGAAVRAVRVHIVKSVVPGKDIFTHQLVHRHIFGTKGKDFRESEENERTFPRRVCKEIGRIKTDHITTYLTAEGREEGS